MLLDNAALSPVYNAVTSPTLYKAEAEAEAETIEITQRAEFITRGLIEIIHGPTCALGALRIIYVCQFIY